MRTLRPGTLIKREQAARTQRSAGLFGHGEAPGLERLQQFVVRRPRRPTLHQTHAIGEKTQRPLGGNRRVELAHRTGGSIARVDKGLLALFSGGDAQALAGVERLEIVAAHIHLAAHLE